MIGSKIASLHEIPNAEKQNIKNIVLKLFFFKLCILKVMSLYKLDMKLLITMTTQGLKFSIDKYITVF